MTDDDKKKKMNIFSLQEKYGAALIKAGTCPVARDEYLKGIMERVNTQQVALMPIEGLTFYRTKEQWAEISKALCHAIEAGFCEEIVGSRALLEEFIGEIETRGAF